MVLSGKLISQTTIKSDGDVFHELFRDRPHHITDMSPNVQGVDLHEGGWGVVGSIITTKYIHNGKEEVAKEVIESIDEESKSVHFKIIEGDLMELYKSFLISVHVDTKGEENLVTWILTYEKLNENVEDPHTFMEFLINVTKDIETHHLKPSN